MREPKNEIPSITIARAILDCAKLLSKLNIASRIVVVKALGEQAQLDLAILKEIEAQKAAQRPVVMNEPHDVDEYYKGDQ